MGIFAHGAKPLNLRDSRASRQESFSWSFPPIPVLPSSDPRKKCWKPKTCTYGEGIGTFCRG